MHFKRHITIVQGDNIHTGNTASRVHVAYRAAGLEPPNLTQPPIKDVLTDIINRGNSFTGADVYMADATSAKKWTKEAIEAVMQAQAANTLLARINSYLPRYLMTHKDEILADAIDAIRPSFEQARDNLCEAAKELPADDPLDMDRVYATHTTRQHLACIEALELMGKLTSLFVPFGQTGMDIHLTQVLSLVDVPGGYKPMPYVLRLESSKDPMGKTKPTPERALAMEFFHLIYKDVDSALVRLANGTYEKAGLSLSLAESMDEVRARKQRHTALFAIVAVETPDQYAEMNKNQREKVAA